jgi:probable addiction module antidote protein
MEEIFEAYAADGDTPLLLASLRVIAQVKGVSELAHKTGMTRQCLQKALSGKGNPRLENINAIMQSMGYHIFPEL